MLLLQRSRQSKEQGDASLEAYYAQKDLVRDTVVSLEKVSHGRSLRVLDYGTGVESVSRAHLTSLIGNTRHQLKLYEPHLPIREPHHHNVSATRDYPLNSGRQFDMVNISYVLNQMSEDEIINLFDDIRGHSPMATVLMVDYTLAGNTREDVLSVLSSDKERAYLNQEGEDAFVAQRSRFSLQSLRALFEQGDMDIVSSRHLTSQKIRGAITALPDWSRGAAF